MTQDELTLVLDALKFCHGGEPCGTAEAIAVIEKALAQPKQKPVATVESVATVVSESGNQEVTMSWWHEPALPVGTKLYTHPPQRSESSGKPAAWVGLTDEEMRDLKQKSVSNGMTRIVSDFEYIRSIEAKLKEKNT